jgi:hypothetical protein
MRIMDGKTVKQVPMAIFLPHAAQAERNHGQTLTRLNERGGLSSFEAYAILNDKHYSDIGNVGEATCEEFLHQQVQDYVDSK